MAVKWLRELISFPSIWQLIGVVLVADLASLGTLDLRGMNKQGIGDKSFEMMWIWSSGDVSVVESSKKGCAGLENSSESHRFGDLFIFHPDDVLVSPEFDFAVNKNCV